MTRPTAVVRAVLASVAVAPLLVLAATFLMVPPASAQDVPNPLAAIPLDQLGPVLEVIGPAAGPVCSGVGVVTFLSPAVLTQLGPLGALVLPALGPVVTLCGAIPTTDPQQRYLCALDEEAQAAFLSVSQPLAGIGPVLDIRPVGLPLDQVAAIVDLLPPEFGLAGLLQQTSLVLQCQQGKSSTEVPPTTAAPTTGGAPTPTVPSVREAVPVSDILGPLPAVLPSSPTAPSNGAGQQVVEEITKVSHDGFAYPGVFVLPFVLLAAVAWFGSGLVRPLQPRTTPAAEETS